MMVELGSHVEISALGLLLLALPLLQPVRGRLGRLLRKAWPRSFIKQRFGRLTITDAAAVMIVTMFATALAGSMPLVLTLGLGAVLVALALMDLRVRQLPDQLTLPLAAAGVVLSLAHGETPWWGLVGLACAGGGAWALAEAFYHLRGVEGLGLGDVKLIAAMGAWLGPDRVPLAIAGAAITALCIEVGSQVMRDGTLTSSRRIPFGAYLAGAFWCAWLAPATAG